MQSVETFGSSWSGSTVTMEFFISEVYIYQNDNLSKLEYILAQCIDWNLGIIFNMKQSLKNIDE